MLRAIKTAISFTLAAILESEIIMNMNEKKTAEEPKIENVKPDFGKEIDNFIKHIEAQADIVPLVMGLLSIKLVQESKHVDKFIKDNGLNEKEENNE